MTKATILCCALALLVLGCSSGQQAPASAAGGVATYGPTSRTAPPPPPTPYAAPSPVRPARPTAATPASRGPTYAPRTAGPTAPASAGTFRWHTRIADAQAQARREGKLILVGTTQSGCGLCEKFKNQIVPRAASRVGAVAVGYMLQARSPEMPAIWQQLRANLPNAGLMPLVGVFTPDLRYLTGFGGPPDEAQLMGALATARRLYPVSARPPERTLPAGSSRVAAAPQRNEYGEYEWTPLEALYPEPEDALTPEGVVAAADPVLPPAPDVGPAAVAPPPTPAPPPAPPVATATVRSAPPAANRAPAPVARATMPSAPAAKAAPPPRPPFHREPEPALEAWGAKALRQALQQIQGGDLGAAKETLAEIGARLPGSTLAREASRGTVAIYRTERMDAAEGRARERIRQQAEKNLGQTMWGVLFRS